MTAGLFSPELLDQVHASAPVCLLAASVFVSCCLAGFAIVQAALGQPGRAAISLLFSAALGALVIAQVM